MPIYSAGADGGNRLGRPGPGKIPTIVPVDSKNLACLAVGWRHNIVIFQDGSAVCWGDNSDFQLGMSHIGEFSRPVKLDAFPNERLVWAHCGDKCTTFLTQTGKVYTCGLSTGRRILELQIPKPCIYVSSGCAVSVAIDVDGAIYRANAGNVSAQKWELPDPACDVAVGANFILALTTQGQVFGLDKFAMEGIGSPTTFLPVPSLTNIQVARVFAYNEHAAVITRDGRVMMCGNGENGRLGLGDTEKRDRFEFLTDLDGANITEIDMGDASTIFIGYDGSVYGCGASEDGRLMCAESSDLIVPTKSLHVPGKAVFVRCGCFHSVVVTDTLRPTHPGLSYFNMTGNLVAIARSILVNSELINTSASSLTVSNLMPGDIVSTPQYGKGRAIGVMSSDIVCEFNGKLREVDRESITFITREGFSGSEGITGNNENVQFDGGHLCSLFGFTGGSIVNGPEGKQYTVLGYAHGTLWFGDDNGRALCLKEDCFRNLHSTFRYNETDSLKYFETSEGNIPIQLIDKTKQCPYIISRKHIYSIIGTFGNFLFCRRTDLYTETKLIKKQICHELQHNKDFWEYDRAFFNNQNDNSPKNESNCGTIIGCIDDNRVIFQSYENMISMKQPVIVETKYLSLISRFAGPGYRIINDEKYDVSIENRSGNIYPTDLFQTRNNGLVSIIGCKNGKFYAEVLKNGKIIEFDKNRSVLLRRHFRAGEYLTSLKTKNDILPHVSVCLLSIIGLGIIQCDEVEISGRNYIVCGTANHYIWLADIETECFVGVAKQSPELKTSLKLIDRPSKHTSIFI